MATLRIRIAASIDSSVQNAFSSIEKAAARAGATIKKQLGEDTRRATREAAQGARQTGDAATAMGRKAQEAGRSLGTLADGADRKFKALATDLRKLPADLQAVTREAQRALAVMERDRARASLGLGPGSRPSRFWFGFGGNLAIKKPHMDTLQLDPIRGLSSFGMGAASYLARAVAGFARAHGIQTDWQQIMASNVSDQAAAQKLVNAGYLPGQAGPNGALQSRDDILAQTRKVSIDTAIDRGELLEGMRKFVGKTGDLDLAKTTLKDMAVLSRATGTSFEDMSDAAAEVANHLGDMPDKGKVTLSIMKQIAGQGKLGAVEVRDLAQQMAKVAATANQFKGGAAANIATLGVFAQEAKLEGGSASAPQAATAVAAFASGLSKKANLKKWQRYGFQNGAFTDASHSELQDPLSIVRMALTAASHGGKGKADESVLHDLFGNERGFRAVAGWQAVYNRAGGGDSGLKAVDREFQRIAAGMLNDEEVQRAFAASMEQSEAKSKRFNAQMAAVVEQVQGSLLPALMQLTPAVLDLAQGFAGFVAGDFFKTMMASAQNVLALVGIGSGANRQQQTADDALKVSMQASSFYSTMKRWEDTHLLQNAEGVANPTQNLAAAQQVLVPAEQQEKALQGQIDPLAKRVAGERGMLTKLWHIVHPHEQGDPTDRELASFASDPETGGKSASAGAFLNDRKALEEMSGTYRMLQAEHAKLIQLLSNGSVTVNIKQSPSPRLQNDGVMPSNSPDSASP